MFRHQKLSIALVLLAVTICAQPSSASRQAASTNHTSAVPCFGFTGNIPTRIETGAEIHYVVPGNGKTELSVFDIEGHIVIRLIESADLVGAQTVRWSGRDQAGLPLSSGVYFIRLEAGGYTDYRKVIVIQ